MAKNDKKAAENAAVENVTVSNIYESLDKASVATDETLPARALEELKKESDEDTIRQIKSRYKKADYTVDSILVKQRKQADLKDIALEELTMVDRIKRFLTGFEVNAEVLGHAKHAEDMFGIEKVDAKAETITITVDGKDTTYKKGDKVPAVIDYVDYDDYLDKIKKEISKKQRAAEEEYDKHVRKLQAKYNQYWDRSWWY